MIGFRSILHEIWLHVPPISFRAMLAALAIFAIDTFDSFGLDSQADEQAARTIGMFEGPFYGMFDQRKGQQAVTVVLIDDASLRNQDWSVPLSYSSQAQLVGAIAYYEPAAIFLDFGYSWAHGDDPPTEVLDFYETLRAEDMRMRVMIGPVRGQTPEDEEVLAPLRAIQSVGVDWRSRTWTNYPFRAAALPVPTQAADNPPLAPPMAAVALYEAWCKRQAERDNEGACKAGWKPPLDDQLAMTWGFGASQAMRNFVPEGSPCLMPNDTIWTRVTHVAERAAGGLFRAALSDDSKLDTAESLCVYSDTVSAGQILNPQQQDEAVMTNLIKDRVILIGAGHSFTPDYHTIPHVGRVPGVFIHAMATDNLITDQDNYTRPPPSLIYDLDWADFIEILLTISVILIMWQSHLFARKHDDKGVKRRILWAGAGLGVVLIGAALAVERMVLHWPPLNIFGVAVLAFSVVALLDDHSKDLAAPEKGG